MGDSTTAEGWLCKFNFQYCDNKSPEMTEAKLKISRDHAFCLLNNNLKGYSQWFPGDENEGADSHSHNHNLTDLQLTKLYFSFTPNQIPTSFKIFSVPKEIVSYIFSMLQTPPEGTQQLERHKSSSLYCGSIDINSFNQSDSTMTSLFNATQK
mmetsp:Transcript_19007/g.26757  ORF Transcript_19007/g.26757 Transcript_19007/m.26757 type:complete len:153 (-) Transcript_19007:1279-1737(-)